MRSINYNSRQKSRQLCGAGQRGMHARRGLLRFTDVSRPSHLSGLRSIRLYLSGSIGRLPGLGDRGIAEIGTSCLGGGESSFQSLQNTRLSTAASFIALDRQPETRFFGKTGFLTRGLKYCLPTYKSQKPQLTVTFGVQPLSFRMRIIKLLRFFMLSR